MQGEGGGEEEERKKEKRKKDRKRRTRRKRVICLLSFVAADPLSSLTNFSPSNNFGRTMTLHPNPNQKGRQYLLANINGMLQADFLLSLSTKKNVVK